MIPYTTPELYLNSTINVCGIREDDYFVGAAFCDLVINLLFLLKMLYNCIFKEKQDNKTDGLLPWRCK